MQNVEQLCLALEMLESAFAMYAVEDVGIEIDTYDNQHTEKVYRVRLHLPHLHSNLGMIEQESLKDHVDCVWKLTQRMMEVLR